MNKMSPKTGNHKLYPGLAANLPAAILVFAFLIFWQMWALKLDAAYILPSPTDILKRLWELRGPLLTAHLPATMKVVGIALVISIFLGVGLAVLMDASPIAERALYPLVIASQTIPTTALAPLFVLWFGYSIWSKVLVAVLFTFFPITITVYDGFRSVKTEMKELMMTFGADQRQIFLKLKLPAVLPYFFSALKMAMHCFVTSFPVGFPVIFKFRCTHHIHISWIPLVSEGRHRINSPMNEDSEFNIFIPFRSPIFFKRFP